jgi:hypothetical protein
MRLQFAEGLLDRIEVRRIRRKIEKRRARRFDRLPREVTDKFSSRAVTFNSSFMGCLFEGRPSSNTAKAEKDTKIDCEPSRSRCLKA